MIEQDTIRLLRECDAGVKMGVSSIEDVLGSVHAEDMKTMLQRCKAEHEKLDYEIREALNRFMDEGKDPNPMAKVMSEMKTGMKLAMHDSDKTIADCDYTVRIPMSHGVDSLNVAAASAVAFWQLGNH